MLIDVRKHREDAGGPDRQGRHDLTLGQQGKMGSARFDQVAERF